MTLLKSIVVCLVLANVGYFLWARGIAKTPEAPAPVMPAAARREIEAGGVRVAAVADACAAAPSRNLVAGAILDELLSMLGQFEREGFAAFRDDWTALDALSGRPARVLLGRTVISGTARGVDQEGALLLDTGDRVQRFVSGEASLRVIEGDT